MEIHLTGPTSVNEITQQEFNVTQINSIKHVKGGVYRQESKTPTFCFDLSRHVSHADGE